MARIRTIKPSFFESEDVSALPLRARLTWIGLWTHCDDAGRTKDNVRLVKARIWPLDDVSLRDVEDDLTTLARHGRIVRYTVDGARYLAIVNWTEHQKIDRPSKSTIPPPPDGCPAPAEQCDSEPQGTDSPQSYPQAAGYPQENRPGRLDEASANARQGKGREGKGREGTRARAREPEPSANTSTTPADARPPLKCEKHRDDPSPPPCGPCADTRRAADQWRADRERRARDAPQCERHRGQPAHNCAPCRAEHLGAA